MIKGISVLALMDQRIDAKLAFDAVFKEVIFVIFRNLPQLHSVKLIIQSCRRLCGLFLAQFPLSLRFLLDLACFGSVEIVEDLVFVDVAEFDISDEGAVLVENHVPVFDLH